MGTQHRPARHHGHAQPRGQDRGAGQPGCREDLSRPPLRQERLHATLHPVYRRRIVPDQETGRRRLIHRRPAANMGHGWAGAVPVHHETILPRFVPSSCMLHFLLVVPFPYASGLFRFALAPFSVPGFLRACWYCGTPVLRPAPSPLDTSPPTLSPCFAHQAGCTMLTYS